MSAPPAGPVDAPARTTRHLSRRRVVLALPAGALALALPGAPAGAAGGLVATIPRIKPSIVGVGTYQELRRPPSRLLGTGFVVGDGLHVLTNNHVVRGRLNRAQKEALSIFIGVGRRGRVAPVEIVARDVEHDIAVLRFAGPKLPALRLGADIDVAEGMSIAFTGFPIGAVLGLYPVTHRGIISARTPIVIPQRSPKRLNPALIKRLRRSFEVYQLDATAYPGNSGSPLYDPETGAVYGIISSVFVKSTKENVLSDPSGITYAVPIGYARTLLREVLGR
jgi:S1-C subfamily serine protease